MSMRPGIDNLNEQQLKDQLSWWISENKKLDARLKTANERADKLRQQVDTAREWLEFFIERGHWRRVYIGHALMQSVINIDDETLERARRALAAVKMNEEK